MINYINTQYSYCKNTKDSNELINELSNPIADARNQVFSIMEQELFNSSKWPYLRSRLLTIFGDRGLQGKVAEIIRKNSSA